MTQSEEITEIARKILEETGFTGGGIGIFESVGRLTLETLKDNGLKPEHMVLDVGCGVLRLGYWLVRYLEPDRYCGIEPVRKYVDAGRAYALGAELEALKRPRFKRNRNFDFSVFGVKFDYVVARSVFSHTAPELVASAMDSFRANSTGNAVMLMSYRFFKKDADRGHVSQNNDGSGWGLNRYSLEYLQNMAREREMFADNYGEPFNGQIWLRLSRRPLAEASPARA